MNRHGLTLIELMLSLLLLTVIVGTSASWVSFAARSTDVVEPERWLTSAERALDLIEQDLLAGDLEVRQGRKQKERESAKVYSDRDALTIRTRTHEGPVLGPVVCTYRFDPEEGTLVRGIGASAARRLLAEVRGFALTHDEEKLRLNVTIESSDGRAVSRGWVYE